MKDLLERGLVFVKGVTSFFDKADGERRNCPRCRGSGLLKPQRIWHWDGRSVGNDPCWFCEGVGVMPLFGLNGFMLGRATAAINTQKRREPVNSPVETHLCLGKYPDSKSTFRSYRPNPNLSSLLYNPGSVPVWVTDAAEELALQTSEGCDIKSEEVGNFNIPGILEGLKSLGRGGLHSSSSDHSRTSTVRGCFLAKFSSERLVHTFDDTSQLENCTTTLDLDSRTQSVGEKHGDSRCRRYKIRMRRKGNHTLNAPSVSSFRHSISERSRIAERKEGYEMEPGLLSLASNAQLIPHLLVSNGTRRVKCARRRRNHVREKMEKETMESTCRLRRLLYSKLEHLPSPDLPGVADALQSFSGSWKDLSQKCLAELTASGLPSNRPRVSQLGPTALYPFLVSTPFYGKLAGKLELIPSVTKALKW